jgi:CheY-like chemotaxis protein
VDQPDEWLSSDAPASAGDGSRRLWCAALTGSRSRRTPSMQNLALVVDANAERAHRHGALLAAEGLVVRYADDGRRALRELDGGPRFRILVTELSLPGLDGFELLRRVKCTPNAGLRVLVASAFRELREAAATLREELGIHAVVTTSSSADAMTRVITRLLRDAPYEESPPAPAPSGTSLLARRESLRAAALDREHVSDDELQEIVVRVARQFGVPIALVSIVLESKQWFKARVGLETCETPLDVAFCRHVVTAKEPMVVPDARTHPVFKTNALVLDKVVRGYAGAPLVSSDGHVWGTLCIIDPDRPLDLNASSFAIWTASPGRLWRSSAESATGLPARSRRCDLQGRVAPSLNPRRPARRIARREPFVEASSALDAAEPMLTSARGRDASRRLARRRRTTTLIPCRLESRRAWQCQTQGHTPCPRAGPARPVTGKRVWAAP